MQARKWLRVIWGIVITLSAAASTEADIAPRPGEPRRPRPLRLEPERCGVSMEHEIVRLRVTPERWFVHVVFTMKNQTNNKLTMPIGFPANDRDELQNFTAKVNDKEVQFNNETETVPANVSPIDRAFERHWKRWPVAFPAKSITKIEVQYATPFRAINTHRWEYGTISLDDIVQSKLTPKRAAELLPKLDQREIHYILKTGKDWDDPIGHCEVEVQLDGMSEEHIVPLPFNDRITFKVKNDHLLVWEAKNFEPDFDIHLRISPHVTRREVEQLITEIRQTAPRSDARLGVFVANYEFAKKRNKEGEAALQQLFGEWQSRVVLWGPEANDSELVADSMLVWQNLQSEVTRKRRSGLNLTDQEDFTYQQTLSRHAYNIANRLENQAIAERPSESIRRLRPEFQSFN